MAVTYNLRGTSNSSFQVGKQGAGTLKIGALDSTGASGSVASITGHLVPSANVSYDLGTASLMWRDVYVGPGSLYINGKKVLEDDSGAITLSTSVDQSLHIKTHGTGQTTMQSAAGLNFTTTSTGDITFTTSSGQVNFDGDVIVNATKSISSSNANPITFADPISVSGNSSMTNLTVTGDLTVQGSTTAIDSTTIAITNSFTFEGSTADNFETTLTVADPTADRTITLPDASGTVALTSDVPAAYTNASVDAHLNQSNPTSGYVLSWNGSDYAWIDNAGYTNTDFDNRLGTKTTDNLTEGSSNLYYTDARSRAGISLSSGTPAYNNSTGVLTVPSTTDHITEGSNLYHTTARVQAVSINEVVEDTTPQLGGDLDVNGNKIVSTSNGDVEIEPNGTGNAKITSTGALILPVGTTAQRPSTPVVGMFRFNSTTDRFEGYNGASWVILGSVLPTNEATDYGATTETAISNHDYGAITDADSIIIDYKTIT